MLVDLYHLPNHLNTIQSHMIQENQVHEIPIMRQRTDCVCCLNRHIIGLYSILRHNHSHLPIVRISVKFQDPGPADTHKDRCNRPQQPLYSGRGEHSTTHADRFQKGTERVLRHNLKEIGKRQIPQFRNSIGLVCANLAVRWISSKLQSIRRVTILR